MTTTAIGLASLAAVLVFWAVGAYNRLITLRNAVATAYAAVDGQLQARHALIGRWLQAWSVACDAAAGATGAAAPVAGNPAATPHDAEAPVPRVDPVAAATPGLVAAAAAQLMAASEALRDRRGAAVRRTAGLRVAEHTLAAARARLLAGASVNGVDAAPDAAVRALGDELQAADSACGYASQQFNDASARYNTALRQFPTRLIGWLFGLAEAGRL